MLRGFLGFILAVLVLAAVWHVYRNSGSDLLKNFQSAPDKEDKVRVEDVKPSNDRSVRSEDSARSGRIPPPPQLKPEWEPAPAFQDKLPFRDSARDEKADTRNERSKGMPQGGPGAYTVQSGDSLWSISKKFYGSTKYVEAIAQSNGMRSGSDLKIGQALTLPDFQSRQRVPLDADHETDAGPGEAREQAEALAQPQPKRELRKRNVEHSSEQNDVMPPTLNRKVRREQTEDLRYIE